jgi:hypothetical protein
MIVRPRRDAFPPEYEGLNHDRVGIDIGQRAEERAARTAYASGTPGAASTTRAACSSRPTGSTRSACSTKLAHSCLL